MNSIGVCIPYFGKLPLYYKSWKLSVLGNDTIDFYLITDNKDVSSEKNLTVIHTDFETLRSKIQDCFDFEIKCEEPYKLCDYKPAYRVIFNDILKKMTESTLNIIIRRHFLLIMHVILMNLGELS